MSGRRRRDDEWEDGRPNAQDDRRDPWADDSVGEWGGLGADPGGDAERSSAPSGGGAYASGGAAGAYVRNAPPGGNAYAAPAFPSFQAGSGSSSADGYGSPAHGDDRYGNSSSPRGASNGHGAGYNGDAQRDASYGAGRDTYQGAGYGRGSSGGGNGGYGRPGYGPGGQGNDSGYGGSGGSYAGANGRSSGAAYSPEFMPVDNDDVDDEPQAGTPRPYGRLSIYTLHDDKIREFDRLAERAAEGVRASEPDTLVYVIHVVPKAPMQRIIYEIYRDRGAFLSHERQPHIRQFAADRASCVLATNIIDLRLKYAKVSALGSTPEAAAQPQASWTPRAAEAAPTQYSSGQYSSAQYSSAPAQGTAAAASFTPAKDRYGADNSQVPTVGREAYSPSPQYGNSGNGGYGAGNAQYGAANSNGYSGAAGYANGGSYSSSGYPSSNGYQAADGSNGYSGDNSYSSANGYQSASGYSGANGYSNGSGYSGANGYSNGSGYSGANGYSNGSGYSSAAGNAGGSGYGAASGYGENGAGSYSASAGAQYTPRYRELTSGSQPDEWPPRPQDYR